MINNRFLAFLFTIFVYCLSIENCLAASQIDNLMQKGADFYNHGEFEKAIDCFMKAANLYESNISDREKIDIYIYLSKAYQNLGRYKEAEQYLDTALPIAKDSNDRVLEALVLSHLGSIYTFKRNIDKAREKLWRAFELADKEAHAHDLKARLYNNIGNNYAFNAKLYARLCKLHNNTENCNTFNESYIEASENYENAIEFAQQPDNQELKASALVNLADISLLAGNSSKEKHLKEGHYKTAHKQLNRALKAFRSLENSHTKANGLIKISLTYRELGDHVNDSISNLNHKAYNTLNEAVSISESLGDSRTASSAYGNLGRFYGEDDKLDKAIAFTTKALWKIKDFDRSEIHYLWELQMGRLWEAQEKFTDAISAYTRANDILESIGTCSKKDCPAYSYLSFHDTVRPMYLNLIKFYISQKNLVKAQETIEDMKILELRDYFKDSCVDDAYKGQKNRHKFDELENTAIIYYIFTEKERLEILLSFPSEYKITRQSLDALRQEKIPDDIINSMTKLINTQVTGTGNLLKILKETLGKKKADKYKLSIINQLRVIKRVFHDLNKKEIYKEIENYRENLERPEKHEVTLNRLKKSKLYDWLIGPIERELELNNINTLIFVPDGPLRTIPMAALYNGEEYLINKYAIVNIIGVNLTDLTQIKKEKEKNNIFLGGASSSLRNGEKELNFLKTLYDSCDKEKIFDDDILLMNEDFTKESIKRELKFRPYSVVHFTTHGEFSEDSQQSFIMAHDTEMTLNDIEEFLKVRKFRKSPINLLTLSACQTAVSSDEERVALGLAGLAVKAGAKSTLATLWNVSDKAAYELGTEFYRQLLLSFKLTEQSYKKLKKDGLPEELLRQLRRLENQLYLVENDFVEAIEKEIGTEQTGTYKSDILASAQLCEQSLSKAKALQQAQLKLIKNPSFTLTEDSYETLKRDARFSDNIISQLKESIDKEGYIGEQDFLDAIKDVIGNGLASKYKDTILDAAKKDTWYQHPYFWSPFILIGNWL